MMKIYVTHPIPGTDYQAGFIYEVPEKQAQLYIENEWAFEIKELATEKPPEKPKKVRYDTR